MKYLLSFLFLTIMFAACSDDKSDMPELRIVEIKINEDETNYADQQEIMPGLVIGDKVDIKLVLDGNKADLMTLIVKENEGYLNCTLDYNENEVTNDPNFTKPDEGTITFIDGVVNTTVTVHSEVTGQPDTDDYYYIHFYLSSKGQAVGGQYLLPLNVSRDKL